MVIKLPRIVTTSEAVLDIITEFRFSQRYFSSKMPRFLHKRGIPTGIKNKNLKSTQFQRTASSIPSSLSNKAAIKSSDFPLHQRWMAVPPANLVHIAIGGIYVYSMCRALGVCGRVCPTGLDSFSSSACIFMQRHLLGLDNPLFGGLG
jgi:hypothetical protein